MNGLSSIKDSNNPKSTILSIPIHVGKLKLFRNHFYRLLFISLGSPFFIWLNLPPLLHLAKFVFPSIIWPNLGSPSIIWPNRSPPSIIWSNMGSPPSYDQIWVPLHYVTKSRFPFHYLTKYGFPSIIWLNMASPPSFDQIYVPLHYVTKSRFTFHYLTKYGFPLHHLTNSGLPSLIKSGFPSIMWPNLGFPSIIWANMGSLHHHNQI